MSESLKRRRCDHPVRRGSAAVEGVLREGLRGARALRGRELGRVPVREHDHQPARDARGARADRAQDASAALTRARVQFTIWVEDANAVIAELANRGVELLERPARPGVGMRTAAFTDPDGHVWEVAQNLAEGLVTCR